MAGDLKKDTKKALIWSALDRGGQQVVFLAIGICTARLLDPGVFGLTGSLLIFTAIANMLLEGGLTVALIRKTDATREDYNTIFYFNFGISLLLYIVLFFCAPLIAEFYRQPELTMIARVQFLVIVIYAFGLIQSTLLIKRMDFKRLAVANFFSLVCAGIVAVSMALLGYGVWALVAQVLVLATTKSLLLWLLCRWSPALVFSMDSFREMFSFSSKLLLGNLINTISSNFYAFIIGRYFPMKQVGFYVQANKMKESASSAVWSVFGVSTYSMLANLQDDPERLKRAIRKTIRTVAFISFPLMLGLAVVSRPLVEILITDRWLPSVPYLQLLCLGAVFFILNYMNSNVIKVAGRSDIILKLEIAGAAMLILFLFLTIRFGLLVAIASDVLSKMIIFGCYMVLNYKLVGYRWQEQLRDIAPYAGISAVMVALIWPVKFLISDLYLLLAVQVVAAVVFYFFAAKWFGSKILDEVLEALKLRRPHPEQ